MKIDKTNAKYGKKSFHQFEDMHVAKIHNKIKEKNAMQVAQMTIDFKISKFITGYF